MRKCSTCDRALSFWQFKCRVCSHYNLRIQHIILIAVLLIIVAGIALVVIEYFAMNQPSPEQKKIDVKLPRGERQRY